MYSSLYFQNFTENGLRSVRNLYKLQEPASNLPTPQEMLGIEIPNVACWCALEIA